MPCYQLLPTHHRIHLCQIDLHSLQEIHQCCGMNCFPGKVVALMDRTKAIDTIEYMQKSSSGAAKVFECCEAVLAGELLGGMDVHLAAASLSCMHADAAAKVRVPVFITSVLLLRFLSVF